MFCSVKQASRAQILDKATEYIQYMRRKNHTHQQDIDDLKKQNALLEQQGEWCWFSLVAQYPCAVAPGAGSDFSCFLSARRSPCAGEGQGQRPDPDQLLVWQQPVHQPQGQRRVGLWRRFGLQLRIGTGWAAQQKEAARGAQLDSTMQEPAPLPPNPQTDSPPVTPTCLHSAPPPCSGPGVELRTLFKEVLSCIKTLLPAFCSLLASVTQPFLRLGCNAPPTP